MTSSQIIDLLERAYEAGCFPEVVKMLKAGSDPTLIEQVIKTSLQKLQNGDPFNWDDLFGAD